MQACACTSRSSRALKAAAELNARVCACVRVCAGGVCHREAGFGRWAMHTAHPATSEAAHFPRPLPCTKPQPPAAVHLTPKHHTAITPRHASIAAAHLLASPVSSAHAPGPSPAAPPAAAAVAASTPCRLATARSTAAVRSPGASWMRASSSAASRSPGVCVCVFVDGDRGGRGGGSSSRARREHGHVRGTQRRRTCCTHSPPSSLHTSTSTKPACWPRHQPTPSHAVRLTCACEVAR
jgi:hypothetical protein